MLVEEAVVGNHQWIQNPKVTHVAKISLVTPTHLTSSVTLDWTAKSTYRHISARLTSISFQCVSRVASLVF